MALNAAKKKKNFANGSNEEFPRFIHRWAIFS